MAGGQGGGVADIPVHTVVRIKILLPKIQVTDKRLYPSRAPTEGVRRLACTWDRAGRLANGHVDFQLCIALIGR